MPFNPQAGSLALPQGSLILVTGSTGYIATHIITQLLQSGYSVRGTARSTQKAHDDEEFHARNTRCSGEAKYHCVVVEDMLASGSLNEAIKGVDGVIHTSSPTDMNPDPNKVIPPLVKHIEELLEACTKVSSIKRFVYTSSSTAATLPTPGRPGHLDKNSWNDDAVEMAWQEPHSPEKGYPVYGASKTEAERALWKFCRERKPKFVVNSVLPDTNVGRVLGGRMGPTGRVVVDLYKEGKVAGYIPSQWMVNVTDCALVHIAALLDTGVANERIFAFDEIFTWNKIMDIISEARPDHADRMQKLKLKDEVSDATTVDNELGGALLKKWFGQEGRGWRGLKTSVLDNLEGL